MLQKGQLGHGDQLQRNVPTVVKGLSGMQITAGHALSHYMCPGRVLYMACEQKPRVHARCGQQDAAALAYIGLQQSPLQDANSLHA